MITTLDRQQAVELIEEAVMAGARKFKACDEMDISVRTYQRWTASGQVKVDGRPEAIRPTPANKLTADERAAVIEVANSPTYKSLPPSQIVL